MIECPTINAIVDSLSASSDIDERALAAAITKELNNVYLEGVKHGTLKGDRSATTSPISKWHNGQGKDKWYDV